MKLLDGKVAIVTGAGSGIGRASACALAGWCQGDRGRHQQASAAQTVDLIRRAGGVAQACCGDVTKADYAEWLVAATLRGLRAAGSGA
jgi:NAD(P)-dependent dehydrogenase (short-subunit alcohol dehydrogenase family)